MINALVFDLGGVLFADGSSVLIKKYGKIAEKVLRSEKCIDLRKGLISDREFWLWAQKILGEKYKASKFKKEWYESYVLDKDIFELLKNLKEKYKLIAFSGNVKSRVTFLDKKYNFRKYFDVEVYSFDHQTSKPEKKFFEILLKKSKCKPSEIIYIDDSEFYSLPAKKLGANVLIYSRGNIAKLKSDLKKFGISI